MVPFADMCNHKAGSMVLEYDSDGDIVLFQALEVSDHWSLASWLLTHS